MAGLHTGVHQKHANNKPDERVVSASHNDERQNHHRQGCTVDDSCFKSVGWSSRNWRDHCAGNADQSEKPGNLTIEMFRPVSEIKGQCGPERAEPAEAKCSNDRMALNDRLPAQNGPERSK